MFEEATSEYSTQINQYNMKNWLWEQIGSEAKITGSNWSTSATASDGSTVTMGTGSSNPRHPHMGTAVYLSEQYGQAAQVGGDATLKSGSVTLRKNGQMYDLQAESSNDLLNMQEIKNIQNLKTGKLIQCAVKIGAIVGGANPKQMQCLENYASNIGLAFQVSDDLLDALGDEILMGKSVRKDDVKNKATFVSLLGADKAQELARDLIKSAKSELEMFDEKNQTLKQLADFIIDRDS